VHSAMQRVIVRSNAITQFAGACGANNAIGENMIWPGGTRARGLLREINIRSMQNIGWQIQLYGDAAMDAPGVVPGDSFQIGHTFQAADGERNGGAGPWRYSYSFPSPPLYDQTDVDAPQTPGTKKVGFVHLMLANRAGPAKVAGAGGYVEVELNFEAP